MALQSTVSTTTGTLIIAPSRQELAPQTSSPPPLQEDAQQPGQKLPQPQVVLKRGNSESFANADAFRAAKASVASAENHKHIAIDAYQSLAFEARKEEIKQIMGVDTYA